jgi:transcriptional regulator with XRE-family HTH domain
MIKQLVVDGVRSGRVGWLRQGGELMAPHSEYGELGAPMLGERVRTMRNYRHKTLAEVAGLAGISTSYLSLLERGLRALDSRSLLYRLADVLECSVAELTGEPVPATSSSHAAALAAVQDVRVAMAMAADGPDEDSDRPVRSLAGDAVRVLDLFMDCRYAECGRLLAPLIVDLSHAAAADDDRRSIPAMQTRAYFTAWSLVTSLGFLDLGLKAAEMATTSARGVDDPVLLGAAEFARAQALYHIGAVRPSLNVCTRAAHGIEAATGSAGVQQVYGMLHLHAAQTCAVSGSPDDARAHLAEAAATAGRTGEHVERADPDANVFELYFGPANVELWRLAIAVEQREGGRGPQIVAGVDQNALGSPNRRAYLYADLGRGLAQERGRDREAVEALCEAERIAPDLVRATPLVRETVTDLLRRARRRAGGRNLTGLAYRMGITHRASVDG